MADVSKQQWLIGGEMGKRTRAFDWSTTPIGPIDGWPQNLKTAVSIMLGCQSPLLIWWGKDLIHFYNDAYIPVLGERHPRALGRPAPEVWPEVWPLVGPQADAVMQEGKSRANEELPIVTTRNGYPEEAYISFFYGPILDNVGQIGGVFCACTEETPRVLGRRRLATLRALADRSYQGKSAEEACEIAAAELTRDTNDLPFTLLYLLSRDGQSAQLAGHTGLQTGTDASRAEVTILEDAVEARNHAERLYRELSDSEDRLRRLNEELEERVHERTAELEAEVKERTVAEERIKNLLRQLVSAQEQERQRIARELHDTLGQQLAALHMSIEVLKSRANGDASVLDNIQHMRDAFDRLNSTLDFLAWELRPPTLDFLGLDAAINSYVREWSEQFGVEALYQGFGVEGLRLSPEAEINVYRILQEALQNVHKHAGASRVNALLERRDHQAVLIVEDNGNGYDVEATGDERGMGLANMRERAALIGGTVEIETQPGYGTTVFVRVPVR